jgi:hypothetical protein
MRQSIAGWLGGLLLLGTAASVRGETEAGEIAYRFWGLAEAKAGCRNLPELTNPSHLALQEFGTIEKVSATEPRRCDCLPQSPGHKMQVDLGGVVERIVDRTGHFVRVRLWRRQALDLAVRDVVFREDDSLRTTEIALGLSALRLSALRSRSSTLSSREPTLVSEGTTPTFCKPPSRRTLSVAGPEGRVGLLVSLDQETPTKQQQQQQTELRQLLYDWFQDRTHGEVCLLGTDAKDRTPKRIEPCAQSAQLAQVELKILTKPSEFQPQAPALVIEVSTVPSEIGLIPYQRKLKLPMPSNRSLAKASEASLAPLRSAVLNLTGGLLDGIQMLAAESISPIVLADAAVCAEYVDCSAKKCRSKTSLMYQAGLGTLVPGAVLLASGIMLAVAGRSEWGWLGPNASCDGEKGRCYFQPQGLDIAASVLGGAAVATGGGLLLGWRFGAKQQVCSQ